MRTEVDELRRQIAVMSGRPGHREDELPGRTAGVLSVPDALAELLPGRGLSRGCVTVLSGARSVLLAVIAAVSRSGAEVGIVGMPYLNLGAILEWQGDLSRIATVPDPGGDPVEVAGVLLDGMDLVVLDLTGVSVPPSRVRVVMGRLRKQASTLLVIGEWPGAQLRIDTEVKAYRHIPVENGEADLSVARSGYGRIGGVSLRVTVTRRSRGRDIGEIDIVTSGFDGVRMERSLVRRPELAVAN